MTPTPRRVPMTRETARLLMVLAWEEAFPKLLATEVAFRITRRAAMPVVRPAVA